MFENFRWTHVSDRRNDLTRTNEPIQIDILRAIVSRLSDAVFLDIGANIGAYAIILSAESNVEKTYAFEPVKSIADQLIENIELNDLGGKVTVHQVVLSDEAGRVDFLVRSDYAGDSGVLTTHLYSHLPFKGVESLPRDTLDRLLNLRGRQIALKIDVEGHELQVLRGATRLLEENTGFLQVEILMDDHKSMVDELLRSVGWYRLFFVHNDHYYTNLPVYKEEGNKLALLENALEAFVIRTRSGVGGAVRRRLFPGVTIDLDRRLVSSFKRFARHQRWKL